MVRTRRWGVSLAAVAVLAVFCLTAPAPLAAQTAQVLSPGQVQSLSQPGVPMKAFPDGRVNTYGVGVDVEAVSFNTAAGTGSEAVTAAPGSGLVVLHITAQFDPMFSPWDDDTSADRAPFQAVVTAGSVSANLFPNGVSGNLDNYVVVDLPDGNQPVLTVSAGGLLPQSINLSTGKRVGTAPQILYRDFNKPVVVVNPQATEGFTGTTGAGQQANGQFSITAAMLSYWQPFTTTFAPSPDQAYLVLFMGNDDLSVVGNTLFTQALPAADVEVTLPEGQTPQTHYGTNVDQISGLFGGFYWAQVPAGVASAKVTVDLPAAGPITANVGDQYSDQTVKVTFANPVSTEISFPAAWTPQNQAITIAPHPQQASHTNRGGFPWAALLIPVLAVAFVGGFLLIRRRRAWLPAREVVWPPRALPPASTALLMRAPALALPPGERVLTDPTAAAGAASANAEPVTRPKLVVRLVGVLEADGLRRTIRAEPQRRLLVCLALSLGKPLTAEEVARGISDDLDSDPQTDSVYSYASRLRRALPEDVFPDARSGQYHLDPDAVVLDWTALATVASEPPDQPGWTDRAIAALELVRGEPLGGRVWEGVAPLARTMQTRIEHIAKTLCARMIAAGDPAAAERAVVQGLLAFPQSVELWGSRLDAAIAGSGYGFERAWVDARQVLKADAALVLPHYQRLKRSLGEQPAPSPDPT